MPTASDLITEASAQLHGYGGTQDRVTPLSASLDASATTFTVDFTFGQSVGITPGVVEIDSELLYVTSVDSETGIVTLAEGMGRGYGGSTAAAHAAGAKVVSRPKFPRVWLMKQLNAIVGSLYPMLFGTGSYSGTVTFPSRTYDLASTTGVPMKVLRAQWQDPLSQWHDIHSHQIDPFDGSLVLGGGAMIGQPLRVLYATQPRQFTSEATDFTSTGLPTTAADLLVLGVVAKQLPGLDISRTQRKRADQDDRPAGEGVNTAKYIMAEYQERLANEAAALRAQYPARVVRKF